MSISKLLVGTSVLLLICGAANAQEYVRVVEPVPAPEDLSDTVRAQFIKPGDVSPEEYARLIAEAEKVKAYQGADTYVVQAAEPQTTTSYVYDGRPNGQSTVTTGPGYQIELFETPTAAPVTPVTTTVAPEPTSQITSQHAVRKGDTLYSISKRYNVSLADLKAKNGLNSNSISIGQVLKVPTKRIQVTEAPVQAASTTLIRNVEPIPYSGRYAVLPGDTLYSIARRSCTSVADLRSSNAIGATSTIHPGQRLSLPAGHCLR